MEGHTAMTHHRHIRIPGLLDLTLVTDPYAILELGEVASLDREFESKGPLLNRVIAGRIRRTLVVDGQPFPAVAPKNLPGRADKQRALEATLEFQCRSFDPVIITAIACEVVRPGNDLELARLAQQLTGRSFNPDFVATTETWAAAVTLDMAIRSNNPVQQLVWKLTGKATRARELLATAMQNDPAAVHAIGIAIHNIVLSLKRMRSLILEHTNVARIVTLSLAAPERILRQLKNETVGVPGAKTKRRQFPVQKPVASLSLNSKNAAPKPCAVTWPSCLEPGASARPTLGFPLPSQPLPQRHSRCVQHKEQHHEP
jgi:hypothetical protein